MKNQLGDFTAPERINVLDSHKGFTALIPTRWQRENGKPVHRFGTLWRPGAILKKGTIGEFVSVHNGNFQNTIGYQVVYKVKGYQYFISCWFDQKGKRIA